MCIHTSNLHEEPVSISATFNVIEVGPLTHTYVGDCSHAVDIEDASGGVVMLNRRSHIESVAHALLVNRGCKLSSHTHT